MPLRPNLRINSVIAFLLLSGEAMAAEIAGRIIDTRTGQGISGAAVRAVPLLRGRRDAQTLSGKDGQYHLDVIRGNYRLFVSVSDSNYLPRFFSASDREEGDVIDVPTYQAFLNINVFLSSGGSISGRVTRQDDSLPVSQVRVSAESVNFRTSLNTLADGSYRFQALPPGKYQIHVLALDENYVSMYFKNVFNPEKAESIQLEPEEEVTGVDFLLRRGGSISGRVFSRRNHAPIPGLKIIAEKQNSQDTPVFAYTDSGGNYVLKGLMDGNYVVESGGTRITSDTSSSGSGFLTQYYEGRFEKELAKKLAIESGNSISGVDFSLVRSSKISGTVRSRTYNVPLSDVTIVPQPVQKETLSPPRGKSDIAGHFLIENLPPGEYVLETALPKKDQRYVKVFYQDRLSLEQADKLSLEEDGWIRGIEFGLNLGATLRGRFKLDDPEYKYDASKNVVTLKRAGSDLEGYGTREFRLNQEGNFVIEGTPPGKYSLQIRLQDPNLVLQKGPEGKTLDVFEGEMLEGLDFSLSVGGSISGTISTRSPFYSLDKLLLILIDIKKNTKEYFNVASEEYMLNGLEPGKYVLVLLSNPEKTHPDTTFQPTHVFDTRTVDVSKGKTTIDVDFQIPATTN